MSVLQTITHEMQVEAVMLAIEIKNINPLLFSEITRYLHLLEQQQKNLSRSFMSLMKNLKNNFQIIKR